MAAYFRLGIVLIALAAIWGCSTVPVSEQVVRAKTRISGSGFTLLSWQGPDGESRFLLFSHDAAHLFLGEFDKSKTPDENAHRLGYRVETLTMLKRTLLTIPSGVPISWQDSLSLGLVHSKLKEMNEICSYAESHHLLFYGCY